MIFRYAPKVEEKKGRRRKGDRDRGDDDDKVRLLDFLNFARSTLAVPLVCAEKTVALMQDEDEKAPRATVQPIPQAKSLERKAALDELLVKMEVRSSLPPRQWLHLPVLCPSVSFDILVIGSSRRQTLQGC